MLLVTGKIITLLSIYSLSFLCSVLSFHSFCQDQHCYLRSGDQLLLLYNSNTFFGQSRRKGFSPSPLLILFALLWKSLISSMMPQVCPTPRYYVAVVESWRQPPSLTAVPSPMSAKGHWVSFPRVAQSFTTSYPLRDCSLPVIIQQTTKSPYHSEKSAVNRVTCLRQRL